MVRHCNSADQASREQQVPFSPFLTAPELGRAMERYRRAGLWALSFAALCALLSLLAAAQSRHWAPSFEAFLAAGTVWFIAVAWYALRHSGCLANRTIRELDRSALRRLERMATIDRGSRSFEYMYLKARLEDEQGRVDRSGGSIGVLYIGVDKLSAVNDRFGWDTGDEVLEELAATMRSTLRVYDTLGRLGSVEYLAILPGIDRRIARRVSERLRRAVEQYKHQCPGGGTVDFVRLSIGLAAYPFNGETTENVVAAARHVMEEVQKAGGNAVSVSEQFVRTDQKGAMVITEAVGRGKRG